MEAETRRIAEEGRQVSRLVENGIDPTVSGLPKANLILVLLIGQAVQVLLLSVSVFLFFVVFGAVAIDESVVGSWIGHDPAPVLGLGAASWELIRVATFLGAFSGLYFTVYAITDGEYRAQFFSDVTEEIGRAVVGQVAYVSLGRRLATASTPPQPPGS